MRTTDCDILIVPGMSGSGPDHWQSRWQEKLSTARRVEQRDWERPALADWVARIVEETGRASRPVVLVAHSLGIPAVVHAAPRLSGVAGAFLVAPPSEASVAGLEEVDRAFSPYPREPLPFPSVVIGSTTDPWCPPGLSEDYAAAWGSAFSDAGDAGHLNTQSGHGPWPEGLMRFAGFLKLL